MKIVEHVQRIVDAMPDDGAVELPVATLRRWLEEDDADVTIANYEPLRDLTVDDMMELAGRARSTVCGWCREKIDGAYRWNGREWRVPVAAWNRFIEGERGRCDHAPPPDTGGKGSTRSLDEYRKVRDEMRQDPAA